MAIRSFEVSNYKPYRQSAQVRLRPLTVLIGKNHSGKSALMKALPLLAGSLASNQPRPLDLEAGGLRHGFAESDLVFGRAPHGAFELGLEMSQPGGNNSKTLRIGIQCVSGELGQGDTAFVQSLSLKTSSFGFEMAREDREYRMHFEQESGRLSATSIPLFEGLLPRTFPRIEGTIAETVESELAGLRQLKDSVTYLKSPRSIKLGWRLFDDVLSPAEICAGEAAPRSLATNDELLDLTQRWFLEALGIPLDVRISAPAGFRTFVGSGHGPELYVGLESAGQGLSQVLPVVVQKLGGQLQGKGVDIVEQPEAELHPAIHGAVADLFLDHLSASRPAIVETHSENFLLRVRRRVAEGKVDPESIGIYWIDRDPEGGARLSEIRLSAGGDLDEWPEGVFYEDFDEVLAIRRAARNRA